MKPLRKTTYCVKAKTHSNFAVNLAEMGKEATICLCLYDVSYFSNILNVTVECIEFNLIVQTKRSEPVKL